MKAELSGLGIGGGAPAWPPKFGLLAPSWAFRPKSEWTGDDWREYALALEESGHALLQHAAAAEASRGALWGRVEALTKKLSRQRRGKPIPQSLLDALETPERKKVSRKKGSADIDVARRAIAVQDEMRASRADKRSVTALQAVEELMRREGVQPSKWRSRIRNIQNAMSGLRNKAAEGSRN
jgi:acyl CoA:acetate/3-ketoacid CoA transferase